MDTTRGAYLNGVRQHELDVHRQRFLTMHIKLENGELEISDQI